MKLKVLKDVHLKLLQPEILKAWHEQEFPAILAKVVEISQEKGSPPELAFSIAANSAVHWFNSYLLENHSGCADLGEEQNLLRALLKAVRDKLVEPHGEKAP